MTRKPKKPNRANKTKTKMDADSPRSLASKSKPVAKPCDFHVVGVGASAGGLEAIEQFFVAMPEDTGAAFVVVQHLAPDFKSHMEELLARKTSLAIKRVTNQLRVQPNTIHLIPPNTEMVIANGQLLLTERDPDESLNLPIDHFLRSLANDCGKKSIGVILSGTGSDGSRGIVDINDAGGLLLCQDEDSAKFDGMPLSAQETNAVHLVLPPERMAHVISAYINNGLTPELLADREIVAPSDTEMEEIFKLLRREHNVDFSLYKMSTVQRRIDRRISLGHFGDIGNYAAVLGDDNEELHTLYKDLLIGVTQFFRDRQAFDILSKDVIPAIIDKKRGTHEAIRVWVAGCATGEEAYSIAISFYEAFENESHPPNIKIFATDVHQKSLQFASMGIYPESSFGEVSPKRLEKYFNKRVDGYEIIPKIRKMIVFAPHNLANDAPFTKLDLVTCRNLLIYFQPVVQKKVISLFHFALRTGSYMFLGPSETPGDLREEFSVVDKKWRLYSKRRDVRLTGNIKLPLGGGLVSRPFAKPISSERRTPETQMLATYDMLLSKFMSPSFLVDERGELLHSFGGAERFLQFRGGRVSTNILQVIHEDLKTSVSGALQHTAKEQKVVRYTGIRVKTVQGLEHVRVVVDPMHDPRTEVTHTLITIEPIDDKPGETQRFDQDLDVSQLSRNHISSLENELRYTKENLQATVEELETSNEEMQAANEELVASNEEMQSTNEELQSVNEELYTVNHEYQHKIGELTELTDDMNNLFQLTDVGVIFLDEDLNIRRFTPKICETFGLLPQDIGRPIQNFVHNIRDEQVIEDLATVLETKETFEREVRDRHDNFWLLRIAPYQTKVSVEGVVLTLIDIGSVKETDVKLQVFRNIVESTAVAVINVSLDGEISSWNKAAELLYGYTAEEAIGEPVTLVIPEARESEGRKTLKRVADGETIRDLRTTRVRKDGELLDIGLTLAPLFDEFEEISGFTSISHDYTSQKKAEEEQQKLATIIQSTTDFVGVCDAQGNALSINRAGREILGIPLDADVVAQPIMQWHSDEDAKLLKEVAFPEAIKNGEWRGVTNVRNNEGKVTSLSAVIIAHKDEDGKVAYISTVGRDITQQLAHEKDLEDREKFLQRTLDGLFTSAAVLLPDGTVVEVNQTTLHPNEVALAANPVALADAAVKKEDVIGKHLADTYWWSHSEASQAKLRDAIATASGGKSVRYDAKARLADGIFITVDVQFQPLKNDEGIVTHLVASAINITDRVNLESKSRTFRRAFESSLTAMVITDPTQDDNPIIYINPGFEKLTGYSMDEVVGRNCRFLQGPKTDAATVKKLRSSIKRGSASHVKLLNYRKNGKTFWNELAITPVHDDEGNLTHFVAVQFDMTSRLKVENQLSRARDVAEAANDAKSSFVANMSHEIRTPLTTVVGMTEVLLEQESDKGKHDTLQLIHQSGRHLLTLVNDVLDMSKIEAGKLEADPIEVDPMQVIEDVASTMGYRAKEKGLEFKLEFKGAIPETIETDPVRLRQILFNLTGNAIKFTENGSVALRCELDDRVENPRLRIEVEDTGIGMRKGELSKLFEQFSQVDSSPTRGKGGSGLGLFISRRIAEVLGGSLIATSKFKEGSTFILMLPAGELKGRTMIDPNAQLKKRISSSVKAATKQQINGRVLVVEDSRGIQVLLRRILENAGATVEVAVDGRAALDLFEANGADKGPVCDLILLDMQMPRLSGYDTAAAIRAIEIETPIIALTASALRGDREKCLSAGCDDYLTKPIDREKLLTKVVRLIG